LNNVQLDLLSIFEREGVRYLLIGGYAIRAHCIDRETHDLDIWVSNSRQNAKRVARGFDRLGRKPPRDNWEALFQKKDIRFAYPDDQTKQVDILTSIGSMNFYACFDRSVIVDCEGTKLRVLGLEDLIASKRVSLESGNDVNAHKRDQKDLDALILRLP